MLVNCYEYPFVPIIKNLFQEFQDWRDFSITSWYPLFSKDTIQSIIIQIEKNLLDKLLNSNNGEESEEIV